MSLHIRTYSIVRANKVLLDGRELFAGESLQNTAQFLTDLYRYLQPDYRKFFKMDNLSKLGFLASELIVKDSDRNIEKEDMAVILWNKSSSLDTDENYQKTIERADDYYPSPSDFVYTLPNIVTGEIAIRNKIHGETACYISEKFDEREIYNRITAVFEDRGLSQVVCGWVECLQENYEAVLFLVEREKNTSCRAFTRENIHQIYNT